MSHPPIQPESNPISTRRTPEVPAGAKALAQEHPAPDVAVLPEGQGNVRITISPPDSQPRGPQSILTKEETAIAVEVASAYGEGWNNRAAPSSLVIEKSSPVSDQEARILEAVTMEVHEGAIPKGSVGDRARHTQEKGGSTLEVPLNDQAVREIESLTERVNEGVIPHGSFASEVKSVVDRRSHPTVPGQEVARPHAAGGVAPVLYKSHSELSPSGGDITYMKAGSLKEGMLSGYASVEIPATQEVAAELQSMTARRNEGVIPKESLAAEVESVADRRASGEDLPDTVKAILPELAMGTPADRKSGG